MGSIEHSRTRKKQWSRRKKIGITVISILAVLIIGGAAYGWYAWNEIFSGKAAVTVPKNSNMSSAELKGRVSILLLGADQREKETAYNTDSIILVTIDTENKRISLLSIPRDTKVEDKKGNTIKINSIAGAEGPVALQQTVSDLTGLPVSGYVLTNFEGFKEIIDALGGVTINVEKNMYYETGDKTDGIINLKKGIQRLDGSKALQYARFRYDALADISRTARQQAVLKAVAKELLQVSTVPKIPTLIPKFRDAVESNISLADTLKLAQVVVGFDQSNMISQTLPGKFVTIKGLSYWEVDPEETKKTVKDLLMGITTEDIIHYDGTDNSGQETNQTVPNNIEQNSNGQNAYKPKDASNGTVTESNGSTGTGQEVQPSSPIVPETPAASNPSNSSGEEIILPEDNAGNESSDVEPSNGGKGTEGKTELKQ